MDELTALRKGLSDLDAQLWELFARRLGLVDQVAQWKMTTGTPIHVPEREQVILAQARGSMPPGLEGYGEALARTLLRLSRERQYELAVERDASWTLGRTLRAAGTSQVGWESLAVVPGAAEQVCPTIFPAERLVHVSSSVEACSMVRSGQVEGAVLPEGEALAAADGETLFIQAAAAGAGRCFLLGGKLSVGEQANQVSLRVDLEPGPEALALMVSVLADLGLPILNLSAGHGGSSTQGCYVEFAGGREDPQVLRALYQLERETWRLRLLGWYPVWTPIRE